MSVTYLVKIPLLKCWITKYKKIQIKSLWLMDTIVLLIVRLENKLNCLFFEDKTCVEERSLIGCSNKMVRKAISFTSIIEKFDRKRAIPN